MRIDLYSILIKNGYKLPKDYNGYVSNNEAKENIWAFIMKQVKLENYKQSMMLPHHLASYSDKQWEKLIWRLVKNGHKNE